MLNPQGFVDVTPELWDKLDNVVVPGTNETAADCLGLLFGTHAVQLPCGFFE